MLATHAQSAGRARNVRLALAERLADRLGFHRVQGLPKRVLPVPPARHGGAQTEERRYQIVIAQKRQAERVRDSLLHEITVIRDIDADRYIWPHVLDQATKALPPYTWITHMQSTSAIVAPQPGQPNGPVTVQRDSLGRPSVSVSIDGRTVDIQAYTTFLRQLAASPWFTDVTPASSQTVIEADRPVTAFTVTVKYRIADSDYIRTVPLVQSMR
jgi:Tfp pilus assembly protein PilN